MRPLDIAAVRAALAHGTAGSDPRGEAGTSFTADGVAREAAVATILRDGPAGAEVLFIRRAQRAGDPWSGQMGFPGGRRDPADESLLVTAVREVEEEIGLDLELRGSLVGQLEDVEVMPRAQRAGAWVRPYVFALRELGELRLNPEEVDEIVWCRLDELHSGARSTTTEWEGQGMKMSFPAWDVEGRIVWGLTYKMLSSLLARFGGVRATR